jgi:hypothetical protein
MTCRADTLNRIKKALNLSHHANTGEAEAKAALAVAQKLMSKINVSQADVIAHESAQEHLLRAGMSIVAIRKTDPKSKPQSKLWASVLGCACELYMDVKSFITAYRDRITITFYGLAANTSSAATGYEIAFNLIMRWAAERLRDRSIHGVVGSNSYREGAAAGLQAHARKLAADEMKRVQIEE